MKIKCQMKVNAAHIIKENTMLVLSIHRRPQTMFRLAQYGKPKHTNTN